MKRRTQYFEWLIKGAVTHLGSGLFCLILCGSSLLVPVTFSGQTGRFQAVVVVDNRYSPTPDFEDFVSSLKKATEERDQDFIYGKVADSFFYQRDFGGMFNASLSGVENFKNVIVLDNERLGEEYRDSGWHELASYLNVRSFQVVGDDVCGPAGANVMGEFPDDNYWFEWGYIDGAGVRVRNEPGITGRVLTQLTYEVIEPTGEVADALDPLEKSLWVEIIMPDGTTGYVESSYVSGFLNSKLCYTLTDDGWMIAGYVGGGD